MSEQDELGALRELIAQLTRRVYHLEQVVGSSAEAVPQAQPAGASPVLPPIPPAPSSAAPMAQAPLRNESHSVSGSQAERIPTGEMAAESLERRIGSQWLNRVGVVAVLIGVSYFLKLAFDNGWIGPGLRVLIGCLGGVGLCWWSERFRRPNSLAFSHSLKAVGVGVLYLSLWASFQLYHLLPAAIAFVAMMLVTAATAGMAITQDAELLAGLALLGGLLTPVLCNTHENHEAALFGYLLLLSLGALALQRVKPWPRILLGAFVGTCLLSAGWFDSYYSDDQFAETLLFLSLLFALFAVAPLCAAGLPEQRPPSGRQAGGFAGDAERGGLFLRDHRAAADFRRFGAAARGSLRAGTCRGVRRAGGCAGSPRRRQRSRAGWRGSPAADDALRVGDHVSDRGPCAPIAPALDYAGLAGGGSAGLLGRSQSGAPRGEARLPPWWRRWACCGCLRWICMGGASSRLLLNARLATFAVAIAALLWMIYLDAHSPDREADSRVLAAGVIVVNLLALLAAGLEIHDTFAPADRRNGVGPAESTPSTTWRRPGTGW